MKKTYQQGSNGEGGRRTLLAQHVMVLLALYNADHDQSTPSKSAEELADSINFKHRTMYQPDCVARYARSLSEEHRGQVGLPASEHHIEVTGENGTSRFKLTDAGLEVARCEHKRSQTAKPSHARADFTTIRPELTRSDMDRIADSLGYN